MFRRALATGRLNVQQEEAADIFAGYVQSTSYIPEDAA
jgi:hypothetical protein